MGVEVRLAVKDKGIKKIKEERKEEQILFQRENYNISVTKRNTWLVDYHLI